MLSVLRVHLPSEIPVVGCEIMPNVLLRRPDNSISNDDVPESAPLVGYYMRYRICEELFIGILHRAWWVGIAALLCLLVAAAIPYFLPLHLLSRTQDMQSGNVSTMKDS